MGTFILIVVFCLIYALILFAIAYSGDVADIAYDDLKFYEPSIYDLSEEEREDYWAIDNYIKNTICPRYHHRILINEISHYQKDNLTALACMFFVNITLSAILLKMFSVDSWQILFVVIATIIGFVCYFVVWLIYKKYSSLRLKNYYEIHSSYDWQSHYNYLLSIKETVIFRHMLRNTISVIALLLFVVSAVYCNIN